MSSWIKSYSSNKRQQAINVLQQQLQSQPIASPPINHNDSLSIKSKSVETQIQYNKYDIIKPSQIILNFDLNLFPIINKTEIIIITNIKSGGTFKYINELINTFNNKYIKYIKITNKDDLLSYNITSNTIILLQQLIHTNIDLDTIINIKENTSCKLILTIHDFSLFTYNQNVYGNEVHSIYVNKLIYNPSIQKLFDSCSEIIIPSQFVKNEINKTYTLDNNIIEHIDTLSNVSTTPYIPTIINYTINIAIPSILSECKGEEFYKQIINNYSKYTYNNVSYKLNFLLFIDQINESAVYNKYKNLKNVIIHKPYNEDEIYDILNKYNIHLLLYLNKWGETYCYSVSKGLNTGLPILYSNIGALIERIPKMPYYFNVDPDNSTNQITIQDIYLDFTNILKYTIINNGSKSMNKETFLHIPTFYNLLFNNNIFKYLNNLYLLNSKQYNIIFNIVQPYAIYFPQFHEIAENNNTFYKGYSDMINLEKVKSNQNEIQTPLRGLLGYYNLKYNNYIIDTQVLLAKSHGFKGFGIYYYWFSKNTITNKNKIFNEVIDNFFRDNFIGFDVFFIYANEAWSNNPSFGDNKDNHKILNEYTEINLNKFADDLIPYFIHNNYRKIDNKPVFFLHQPWEMTIDEINLMYEILYKKCKEYGFDGIHFIVNAINGSYNKFNQYYNHPVYKDKANNKYMITAQHNKLQYDKYINNFINTSDNEKKSIIKSCFTNFNNCVRLYNKKDDKKIYTSTDNCTAIMFKDYINKQLVYYKSLKLESTSDISKIMLFNAWNKWGEQMVIEPSNELGFLYLNIINDELLKLIR